MVNQAAERDRGGGQVSESGVHLSVRLRCRFERSHCFT